MLPPVALSMAALSAALSLPQLASVSGSLAVGCTVLYVASFALGAGPLPAVLVSELFPAKLRGTASAHGARHWVARRTASDSSNVSACHSVSAALLSHWACNVLVGQTFLALVEASSVGTVYASFALVCALAVFFVSARLPETKGREYAEVAALLSA